MTAKLIVALTVGAAIDAGWTAIRATCPGHQIHPDSMDDDRQRPRTHTRQYRQEAPVPAVWKASGGDPPSPTAAWSRQRATDYRGAVHRALGVARDVISGSVMRPSPLARPLRTFDP